MYEITSSIYLELAELLVDAIADKEFYSGVVVCHDGEVRCRLLCTVIVSREERTFDGGTYRAINRIIPVWWELQTFEGEELVKNDFSFEQLRKTILGD